MGNKLRSFELAKQYLGKKVDVIFDRPLGAKHPKYGFIYKINYGYLPTVIAPDGEGLDVYYLGEDKPLKKATGICIAIIHREDDNDDKLVVVSEGSHFSDEEIMKQVYFQEQYFKSSVYK